MEQAGTMSFGGGVHGVFQIVGEYKKQYVDKIVKKFEINVSCMSYKVGQMTVTFLLTTFAWIFFRSSSIKEAVSYIYRMINCWDFWIIPQRIYFSYGLNQTEFLIAIISIIVLVLVDCVQYKKGVDLVCFLNGETLCFRWFVYLSLFFSTLIFGMYGPSVDTKQFIYFQF